MTYNTKITLDDMRNATTTSGYSIVADGTGGYFHALVSGGGGGGGGSTTFLGLTDTPSVYTDKYGYSAVVNFAEDGLEFINVSGGGGGGGSYTFALEDVTSQIPDVSDDFTLAATPASGSLVVHYNGITQQPNNYNIITGGFHTLFSPVSGEELVVEYYTDVPEENILGLVLEVQDTDVTVTSTTAIINFEGMAITDEGGGKVTVSGGIGGGGGGAETLDELTDVVITSVVNNEVLAYDTGGDWINQTAGEAGLSETDHTHAFLDLDDVDESDYTGFEGYSVVVNAGEDGLEFVNVSGGAGGGIEVEEGDVSVATDVTVLNFEGAVEAIDEGGGKVTVNISGGGGGGTPDFTIWMPEAPPASAYSSGGTDDDEFDDASFDTGMWTEFDVATTQTVGEDEYGVHMVTTSVNHIQGIFQAAPTGSDWSFTTYVGPMWDRASNHRAGILLIENTSALSTSDVVLWANFRGGAGYGWQCIYHTDYDSWNADDYNSVGTTGRPFGGQWLRFRTNATTWWFDWSVDGKFWVSSEFSRARRFDVQGIGVGHKFDSSLLTAQFPFARFRDDSARDQMLYGDRVNMWRA